MELVQHFRFHGEDYDDPNSFGQFFLHVSGPDLAMAISVGGKAGCHPYTDLNEDSVGIATLGDLSVAAVADAHNGSIAAKLVVDAVIDHASNLVESFQSSDIQNDFEDRIVRYVYPQSVKLAMNNQELEYASRSRTQLSVLMCDTSTICWANFGDSRIYSNWKTNGSFALAPVRRHRFIGHPMTEEEFRMNLQSDVLTWPIDRQNPMIIVCSDGFPEARYPEVSPSTIIEWTKDTRTAADTCEKLMKAAFELEACDNLSCAVLRK